MSETHLLSKRVADQSRISEERHRRPLSRQRKPTSKEKPKKIRIDHWKVGFKEFLRRNRGFERVFTRIRRAGAEEPEVLELLYRECYERPVEGRSAKKELRAVFDRAVKASQEAARFSREVELLNHFLLAGLDVEEDVFLLEGDSGKTFVPAGEFAYLPRLLLYFSQQVIRIPSRLDPNQLEINGPELAILGIYVRELTGEAPFRMLTDLLEAAYAYVAECSKVENNRFRSVDAIRKALERYRRDHPQTYRIAEDLITSYVAKRKAGEPQDSTFWWNLYESLYDDSVKDIIRRPKRIHRPTGPPALRRDMPLNSDIGAFAGASRNPGIRLRKDEPTGSRVQDLDS